MQNSGGASFVMVVQSSDLGNLNYQAFVRAPDVSWYRSVLCEGKMRVGVLVMLEVRFEEWAQTRFVEDDEVIQALTSNRPN